MLNQFISIAGAVLNSLNKPEILRNNRLIQFGFYIVLIYPFVKFFGLVGVSLVMLIFSIVSLVHITPHIAKEIPGFYSNSFKIIARTIPLTLLMMAVVYLAKRALAMNLFWLFSLVFLGIMVYFIPMWFIDPELKWDYYEGLAVIKEKLRFLKR